MKTLILKYSFKNIDSIVGFCLVPRDFDFIEYEKKFILSLKNNKNFKFNKNGKISAACEKIYTIELYRKIFSEFQSLDGIDTVYLKM